MKNQSRIALVHQFLTRNERWVFLLFFGFAMLHIWMTKYVPSLDGPQHLYTANVLSQILQGSESISQFFKINSIIVGYWTGTAGLTFFKLFAPAWLAEKLFLTTYVIGMLLSYRYFLRSFTSKKGNFVAYLIFPFIFHSYLLMGYYSFSIAAIFFFLLFGYWSRHSQSLNFRRLVILSAILMGLFLSHGFVYALTGLSLIVYIVIGFISESQAAGRLDLKKWALIILKLFIATLPSLILWVIYIQHVMGINSTVVQPDNTFSELFLNLTRIRQLVGFGHEVESIGYRPIFFLILLLSGILFYRFSNAKLKLDNKKAPLLFAALVFLALYFFAPNRLSAGSLTNRFAVFFFFAFIGYISVQKWKSGIQVLAVFVLLVSFAYTRIIQQKFLNNLTREIKEIESLSEHIPNGSTLFYLQDSKNWVHLHFQLYMACDKEIVHLFNPQCNGQFPVEWNMEKLPQTYANDQIIRPYGVHLNDTHRDSIQVDYVSVFYHEAFLNNPENINWVNRLKNDFILVGESSGGKVAVYKNLGMGK